MALWAKHGIWLIPLGWFVLSMVLNVAFRKKSPEAWVEYAKQYPRIASIIRLVSAVGIDPAKALLALKAIATSKAKTNVPPALEIVEEKVEKVVDAVVPEKEESKDAPKEESKSTEETKP